MKPDERKDPEFQAYLEHHRRMRYLGETAQALAQAVEKHLERSLAPLQQFADKFVRAGEVAQQEAAAADSAQAAVQPAPTAVGGPTRAEPDTLKSAAAAPPAAPDVAREQSVCTPRPELPGRIEVPHDQTAAEGGLGTREDRYRMVNAFVLRCKQETHVKVIEKYIWLAAEHRSPRQFQYWKAGDSKATRADDQNFRRLLNMNPSNFVALLLEKGLVKQ